MEFKITIDKFARGNRMFPFRNKIKKIYLPWLVSFVYVAYFIVSFFGGGGGGGGGGGCGLRSLTQLFDDR